MTIRFLPLIILFIFSTAFQTFGQNTTCQPSDIEGIWKCTKPGKEITLEIHNGVGTIISVEGTAIPSDLLKGNMYESIVFENGKWNAIRNKWIYPGVDGQNATEGHWEKGEPVIMQLNAAKNELDVIGHWTYRKIKSASNVLVLNSSESVANGDKENILTEEYGELLATYRFVKSTNTEVVISKFKNRSASKQIALSIKNQKGEVTTYTIEPGQTLSLGIKGHVFEIQMGYKESDYEEESHYLMNLIKEGVRKIVVDENGIPKSSSTAVFGVRG